MGYDRKLYHKYRDLATKDNHSNKYGKQKLQRKYRAQEARALRKLEKSVPSIEMDMWVPPSDSWDLDFCNYHWTPMAVNHTWQGVPYIPTKYQRHLPEWVQHRIQENEHRALNAAGRGYNYWVRHNSS